jgi:hypothetical protein
VVDIAEEDDFEIVVGWAQAAPFLECGTLRGPINYGETRLALTQGLVNGILEVDVLNDLVCPAEDAPISINVFVSMCEDAKFAAPTNAKLNSLHLFPEQTPVALKSQSGTMGTENPTNTDTDRPTGSNALQMIGSTNDESDQTYTVFYGDPPTTLRELCKRYCHTRTWVTEPPAEGVAAIDNLLNKDAPYQSGWDPEGIDLSEVDGTTPLNVVRKDFASWWSPCYAGVRGARRKKYLFSSRSGSTPTIYRDEFVGIDNGSFSRAIKNFTVNSAANLTKWATLRTCPGSGLVRQLPISVSTTPLKWNFRFMRIPAFAVRAMFVHNRSPQIRTMSLRLMLLLIRRVLFLVREVIRLYISSGTRLVKILLLCSSLVLLSFIAILLLSLARGVVSFLLVLAI